MSVQSSLPVLFVQMGHVQKITHQEQSHPETQQAAAQQAVADTLKREQQQVEKIQDSANTMLKTDADGGRGRGEAHERHTEREACASEEETQGQGQDKDPWTGNIVNVKV